MSTNDYQKLINDFEQHYTYDGTYMRDLLETSPAGFAKFSNFLPLSSHRETLTVEEFWITKLAAMQVEDCGDCLLLNVKMALEDGVERAIINAALNHGEGLSPALQHLYNFATQIAANRHYDDAHFEQIRAQYDRAQRVEIGLAIASARVFPTIKRSLGYTRSCGLFSLAELA